MVGRTPLDEWSARRRDLYLTNTQHSQQTNIHAPGGIRTRNPSKRSAGDPRLRSLGQEMLFSYFISGNLAKNSVAIWMLVNIGQKWLSLMAFEINKAETIRKFLNFCIEHWSILALRQGWYQISLYLGSFRAPLFSAESVNCFPNWEPHRTLSPQPPHLKFPLGGSLGGEEHEQWKSVPAEHARATVYATAAELRA